MFKDKAQFIHKIFSHTTNNGNSVYTYIFERLERFDKDLNEWRPYPSRDVVHMKWNIEHMNLSAFDTCTIEYARRGSSWDFKIINAYNN